MDFYAPLPEEDFTLQQGDLLADIAFSYFSLSNAKVTLENRRSAMRDLSRNRTSVRFVAAAVEFSWGIILSQTCDVQPDPESGASRKPIILARVRPIKEIIPSFRDDTVKNSLNAVKVLATPGKSPTVLYLPAHRQGELNFPRSGADLLDVQRFPAQDLAALKGLARLRLKDAALQVLQERCAYCFGRFGAPDELYYSNEEWAEIERQEEARRQSRPH